MRAAGHRDLVEGVGDDVGVGRRPEVQPVEQVEHDDGDGELVAGLRRQHRGVAALGVLGDQRALRRGAPPAGSRAAPPRPPRRRSAGRCPPARARRRGRGCPPSRGGRPRARPRTAPGRPARGRRAAAASRDRRPRRPAGSHLREALHRLGERLGGRDRLAAYSRTGLGDASQARIGTGQRRLVVEEPVVEGHLRERPGRLRPVSAPRRRAAPGCRRSPGRRSRTRCTRAPRRTRRPRARPGSSGTRSGRAVAVEVHRRLLITASTSSRTVRHDVTVDALDVEPQQRLGVGGANIEQPPGEGRRSSRRGGRPRCPAPAHRLLELGRARRPCRPPRS